MWLRSQFRAVKGVEPSTGHTDYAEEVSDLVDQVNPQGFTKSVWKDFLCDAVKHPDSMAIEFASGDSDTGSASQHMEMLARALMLLRMATGACRQVRLNAGLDKENLRFWWHQLGVELAMWNESGEPDQIQDLWMDVKEAITELDTWLAGRDMPQIRELRVAHPSALGVVDETERVALWGLGL